MSSKGVLNEEHLDLRVGQEAQSHNAGRAGRIVSRGLKGIVVFLIAFLAANGFWALVRPELYGNNGLLSLNGGVGGKSHHKHHHHHHHHDHDHKPHPGPPGPPGHGHPHPPPPPPHGPPGHDHPHPPPPPPPPHKPGHGPGGDHPPPPPPPHRPHPPPPPGKGPGKVQECFELQPGKTLEIRAPLEWFGQGVQVAPSLAGSQVTFVWDGEVGSPVPPHRGPHRGPPPPPSHPTVEDESDEEEDKNGKEEEDKPEKKLGEVIYEIQVPSKAEWKDADVSSDDLKICTVRHFWSTGLDVFNSSGIPPSHAHIDPAFEKLAPRFNTTVRLPSHFARSPLRAGPGP